MKEYLTGLQHIGIPTKHLDKTIDFFGKLGFEVAFSTINEGNQVAFLKLGNLVIETYEDDQAKMMYGAIDHVAINVTDIETVFKNICAIGLNTLDDEIHFLPFWENGVKFFTIEGPNKERVEFSQYL